MLHPRKPQLFTLSGRQVIPLVAPQFRKPTTAPGFFVTPHTSSVDCAWTYLCQHGPFDVTHYVVQEFGCSPFQVIPRENY